MGPLGWKPSRWRATRSERCGSTRGRPAGVRSLGLGKRGRVSLASADTLRRNDAGCGASLGRVQPSLVPHLGLGACMSGHLAGSSSGWETALSWLVPPWGRAIDPACARLLKARLVGAGSLLGDFCCVRSLKPSDRMAGQRRCAAHNKWLVAEPRRVEVVFPERPSPKAARAATATEDLRGRAGKPQGVGGERGTRL
jgi:hypothetical protein